jgi:hypothetical protein
MVVTCTFKFVSFKEPHSYSNLLYTEESLTIINQIRLDTSHVIQENLFRMSTFIESLKETNKIKIKQQKSKNNILDLFRWISSLHGSFKFNKFYQKCELVSTKIKGARECLAYYRLDQRQLERNLQWKATNRATNQLQNDQRTWAHHAQQSLTHLRLCLDVHVFISIHIC